MLAILVDTYLDIMDWWCSMRIRRRLFPLFLTGCGTLFHASIVSLNRACFETISFVYLSSGQQRLTIATAVQL